MSQIIDEGIFKPKSNIICVSPLPKEFSLNQYKFFKQFGELRFVGLDKRSKELPVIGFVEFEDDSVAEELIAKGQIDFEDKRLQVKPYSEYKHCFRYIYNLKSVDISDACLQPPPPPDSPKNILNVLNDDCLREIFRKLHYSTLNAVVNVCICFNRVAKEAFLSKYHLEKINILDLEWERQPTVSQVENFLSNFGSAISSVSFSKESLFFECHDMSKSTDIHLKLISKYCMNVKSLEFCSYFVQEQTLFEIRSLFERLEKLKIKNLKCPSAFVALEACAELQILDLHFKLDYERFYFYMPKRELPKLVEASIRGCPHYDDFYKLTRGIFFIKTCKSFYEALERFLKINSKLKILKTNNAGADSILNEPSRLSELNELELEFEARFFIQHSLKTLTETFSKNNIRIESLKLNVLRIYCTDFMDFLNNISELKHVTTLKIAIDLFFNRNNLVHLLQNMPHLKDLYIYDRMSNSESNISIIKSILRNAHQLSKLTIESDYNEESLAKYSFDAANYYDILESVVKRNNGELTIVYILGVEGKPEYLGGSQSIYTLNMSALLSVEQQFNIWDDFDVSSSD